MPVIRVEMFKRTQEQKRNLARELTEAFVNTCVFNFNNPNRLTGVTFPLHVIRLHFITCSLHCHFM